MPYPTDSRFNSPASANIVAGGGDSVKLDDLAAPDDNTDLNSSTSKHGLCPKLGGGSTNFLRADGTWAAAGGGAPPTGTGFRHITSGAEDAAAKLVETADVSNDQITYAKIQNVSATDKLLGRSTAGAGDIEEIACTGAGRALIDDADNTAQRTTLGLGGAAVLSVGSSAGTVCAGDDGRLSDARTPTAHATSHKSAGGDAVKLDELAAPTDVTTLDVTTSLHGLCPKAPNDTTKFLRGDGSWATVPGASEPYPVGSVFIAVVSTNPNTLLGYGTWSAFGAGRVLVGLNSGDTDFDTAEETGGSKTVSSAGSVAAPTISGSTGSEAAHTHSVTSNVSVDNHASHTHTYTEVPNHVHVQTLPSTQAGNFACGTRDTSSGGTGGSAATIADTLSTANPTGGVATGTTAGPSATLTHTTNNPAVTSGAGSSHLHTAGTLAASAPTFTGSATSVVQPYIVVYMWKRTA
jgi:hypothetical protein